ncbi:spore coat associated protein CotJA [Eubacteriales bacterium OttesenSCG-928-M02]|nr:spore coat associated protein CotJA [Eubacteriales bacterium OttesenSCG-928-M02]
MYKEQKYMYPPGEEFSHMPTEERYGCCGVDCMPLVYPFIAWQGWETPYQPDMALTKGTIFPSLDLPFRAKR